MNVFKLKLTGGVKIKDLFLEGINKIVGSVEENSISFYENISNNEEYEILTLYYKILKRIKNKEFIIDAFFREIQNTGFEEMMVKKPILQRKGKLKEAFRGCIYVFVNGDNKDEYASMIEEYEWLGLEFLAMCEGVLIHLESQIN